MDKALMIMKHEAIQRCLMGEILRRIEGIGLKIISMKMKQLTREEVDLLYANSKNEIYYNELLMYNIEGPVLLIVVQGVNGNESANSICGNIGIPGTVRGDLALHSSRNLLHCSDPEDTEREINLFFNECEIYKFIHSSERWVH